MKITRYRKNTQQSALISYFSIEFETKWGPQYINDLKLFNKNGHFWIGFPDRQYKDEKEETKYFPYMGFKDKSSHQNFESEVMQALQDFSKNPNQHQIPQKESKIAEIRQYKDDDDLGLPF